MLPDAPHCLAASLDRKLNALLSTGLTSSWRGIPLTEPRFTSLCIEEFMTHLCTSCWLSNPNSIAFCPATLCRLTIPLHYKLSTILLALFHTWHEFLPTAICCCTMLLHSKNLALCCAFPGSPPTWKTHLNVNMRCASSFRLMSVAWLLRQKNSRDFNCQ